MLSTLTHYAGHSLADVLAMSAETRLSLYKKFNEYAALLTVFPAEVVAEMNQAQRDAEFKVFCARSKEEKLKEQAACRQRRHAAQAVHRASSRQFQATTAVTLSKMPTTKNLRDMLVDLEDRLDVNEHKKKIDAQRKNHNNRNKKNRQTLVQKDKKIKHLEKKLEESNKENKDFKEEKLMNQGRHRQVPIPSNPNAGTGTSLPTASASAPCLPTPNTASNPAHGKVARARSKCNSHNVKGFMVTVDRFPEAPEGDSTGHGRVGGQHK